MDIDSEVPDQHDWNDGQAVACLVDAVAPGLFPECEDLDSANRLVNARQAMQAAEDWLGVPQVDMLQFGGGNGFGLYCMSEWEWHCTSKVYCTSMLNKSGSNQRFLECI